MTCSFFRRGKSGDVVSPEMSKMNERLSFSKRRGYSLCSSLGGGGEREDCWAHCPSLPRFYRREKKQKMVEVLLPSSPPVWCSPPEPSSLCVVSLSQCVYV